MKTALDHVLLKRVVDAAADRLRSEESNQQAAGRRSLDDLQRELLAAHAVSEELTRVNRDRLSSGMGVLEAGHIKAYEAAAIAEMFDEGASIDQWLSDNEWDELDANGCDSVWVTYPQAGKIMVEPLFDSDEQMLAYLQTIARRGSGTSEFRFDGDAYELSLELEDGSRLYALWGGKGQRGVATRPALCIRRHRLRNFSIDDLQRAMAVTPSTAQFIKALVRARQNIAFAGPTNAGKTTWLRAAAHEIPLDERIVTVEKTRELFLSQSGHQDVTELESRESNTEGRGGVPVADLVRASLRLNPTRVLLGEILGPADVTALLNVMSQGNAGSMCTLHSNSAQGAFGRLISLCLQSPERLTAEASGSVIASAIDFVVYINAERVEGGGIRRYVSSVREVGGWDGRQIMSSEVCAPGADKLAEPSLALLPARSRMLAEVGYSHRSLSGGLR